MYSSNNLKNIDQAALLYKMSRESIPQPYWNEILTILKETNLGKKHLKRIHQFVDLKAGVHKSEIMIMDLGVRYLIYQPNYKDLFTSPFVVVDGVHIPHDVQKNPRPMIHKTKSVRLYPNGKVKLHAKILPDTSRA